MREMLKSSHLGERAATFVARKAVRLALARQFQPDYVIGDVHDLTAETLRKQQPKLRLLIFDVDKTLEGHLSNEVSDKTKELLSSLRDAGYKIALASNCDERRAAELGELFGLYVDHIATPRDSKRKGPIFKGKKPTTGMIDHILEQTGCTPEEAMIFGDQLLKDTLVGKRSGIKTTHVAKYGEGGNRAVELLQTPIEKQIISGLGTKALANGSFVWPDQLTSFRRWAKDSRKGSVA